MVTDYGLPFEPTYGSEPISVAAAQQHLIINSKVSAETFDVYSFCGVQEHYISDI